MTPARIALWRRRAGSEPGPRPRRPSTLAAIRGPTGATCTGNYTRRRAGARIRVWTARDISYSGEKPLNSRALAIGEGVRPAGPAPTWVADAWHAHGGPPVHHRR